MTFRPWGKVSVEEEAQQNNDNNSDKRYACKVSETVLEDNNHLCLLRKHILRQKRHVESYNNSSELQLTGCSKHSKRGVVKSVGASKTMCNTI